MVNGSDFNLLAANFNQGAAQSALGVADASALSSFAAANGISLTSVPEPASAAMLVMDRGRPGAPAPRRPAVVLACSELP